VRGQEEKEEPGGGKEKEVLGGGEERRRRHHTTTSVLAGGMVRMDMTAWEGGVGREVGGRGRCWWSWLVTRCCCVGFGVYRGSACAFRV